MVSVEAPQNNILPHNPLHMLALGLAERCLAEQEKRFAKVQQLPNQLARHLLLAAHLDRPEIIERAANALIKFADHRVLAIGQLARLQLKAGANISVATAKIEHLLRDDERHCIASAIRAPLFARRVPPKRHIAICGVSHCGSTLVSALLAAVPDVATIGESHKLTRYVDGDRRCAIDVTDFANPDIIHCVACGAACPLITPHFRTVLALDPVDWYRKIALRLGADTLVSSDKNLPKLLEHDPLLRMDAVVLFKPPIYSWLSRRRKLPQLLDPETLRKAFDEHIDSWISTYEQFLDGFRPTGDRIFLDFAALTRSPQNYWTALCRRLGLAERFPQRLSLGHAIGGNRAARRSIAGGNFIMRPLDAEPIDLPSTELLKSRPDASALYARLCSVAIGPSQ